jgi:hypothetical protein
MAPSFRAVAEPARTSADSDGSIGFRDRCGRVACGAPASRMLRMLRMLGMEWVLRVAGMRRLRRPRRKFSAL